jgi:hypothetical protein
MTRPVTADAIRALGLDWPGHPLIAEHQVVRDGHIDLDATAERLRAGRAEAQRLINAAHAFKQATGADYSDFTDRFDDHVRRLNALQAALAHLGRVLAAVP